MSSEWAADAIYVDKTWNARQSAPQSGSALSASNPPGWRPAALSKPGASVLVQSSSSLASIDENILPGTAAISSDRAEGIQVRTNTTASLSPRDQNDAVEQNACESTDVPETPAGNRTPPTTLDIAKSAGIAQKRSRNTLRSGSSLIETPDVPLHEVATPSAASKIASLDLSIRATTNASATRPTRGGNEGQQMQEHGKFARQKDGETLRERAQEHEDGSEDQVEQTDNGDGGDNNEGSANKHGDEEERGATAESRPLLGINGEVRQKLDRHMAVNRPLFSVATSNPNKDVVGEASGQGQGAEERTEGAQDSSHNQSTAPVHRSACSNRAVADGNHAEAHAGQSMTGVDGEVAVSAQNLPSSPPINRPLTASLPRTSTGSQHDDSDHDDSSTSSDCITLSAERVLDADGDHGDMPMDNADPGRKASRAAGKRASTAALSTFKTPTKRQKRSADIAGSLANSVVKKVPRHLIQPAELYERIVRVLGDSDNNVVMPLMSFFFSLASPPAIGRLRDACVSVRNSQKHSPLLEEAGVLQSMQALDRIETQEHVSPILRRYHLVQLVKRRDKIYEGIVASGAQSLPLVRQRGLRKQTATSANEGTKRAAALALERLVSEAYPDDTLQMTEDNVQGKTAQREKRFKKLENRLSKGQNWNLLQKKFGIGILALVYTGPDAGFSNTV